MSGYISNCVEISNHKNDENVAPIINKCINRIAQIENFQDYTVDVQDISTGGGNFMATLQTINIKGKTETANKEISLFVKNKFQSIQDSLILLNEFYEHEVLYYNELSKIYDELQDEANIPVHERLRKAKSYNESNLEVIILEDLSIKGYTTRHRLEPISLQFAEMSIEQLAKFHALSFVLQSKKPQYYEMKVKPFTYPVKITTQWEDYIESACTAAAKCLDSDSKIRLENFKEKIVQVYKNYANPPNDQATCLCHGDFRANNILVKEEVSDGTRPTSPAIRVDALTNYATATLIADLEEIAACEASLRIDGDIKDLIVVDYQTIRYGSPVTDFIYFIFTGTDQKFRRDHLDELKELYYETLQRFLSEFGIKVHDVYSKKRFEKEYRDFLDTGLALFLTLSPFLLCSGDDIPDLQKDSISNINFNFNKGECNERLLGIVEDFTKWGYL